MKRLALLIIVLFASICSAQVVYQPQWYDAGTYIYPANNSNVQVYDNGNFSVSPDTDATVYLGRAVISSPASDQAAFSHYDNATSTGYALLQYASGTTRLNTGSSTGLQFAKLNMVHSSVDSYGNWGIGTGSSGHWSKLSVDGGDISVRDVTDLASESLTNGALTSGTSWSATNDCALTSNAATWTYSAGTESTLTQACGTLAIAGIADAWYYLTYTVSGVSGTPTASITTAFASSSTALTITNGAKTLIFKSAASPGDFVITSTLTAGQAFTLDSLSLKMIIGGDVVSAGVGRFRQSYYTDLNGTTFRDCQIKLDGTLGYDSSSIRGKIVKQDLPKTDTISRLRPVVYEPKKRAKIAYEVDIKAADPNLPPTKETRYKDGEYIEESTGLTEYGLIAEEVEKVDPELVFYDPDGSVAGVHYGKPLMMLLLKTVQEQQKEIEDLKVRVSKLEVK